MTTEGGQEVDEAGSIADPERGVTLIFFVLVLLSLLTVMAIVIDLGNARQQRRQLQNAVDAAALAGAKQLGQGCAGDFAVDYAINNLGFDALAGTQPCESSSWSDVDGSSVDLWVTAPYCVDANGNGTCDAGEAGAVGSYSPGSLINVRACRDVPTSFGRLLGRDQVRVCADSTARNDGGSLGGTPQSGSGGCPPGTPPNSCGVTPPLPFAGSTCAPAANAANLKVDGRANSSGVYLPEPYQNVGNLAVVGSPTLGNIWFACDTNYLYFAMKFNALSTAGNVANENVYGPAAYHTNANTGWQYSASKTGGGDYLERVKSEHAVFQLNCDSTLVHSFKHQYVDDPTLSSGFKSSVKAPGRSKTTGITPPFVGGPAANDVSSSMVYNLNNPALTGWSVANAKVQSPPFLIPPGYPSADPAYPNWEWSMLYEFRVPRAAFSACGTSSIQVLQIHSSPPKVAGWENVLGGTEPHVSLVG